MNASEAAQAAETNDIFNKRVRLFMTQAASNVYEESTLTAGHVLRVELAAKIIRGEVPSRSFAYLVLANAPIQHIPNVESIPDNVLRNAVIGAYNAVAGVETGNGI